MRRNDLFNDLFLHRFDDLLVGHLFGVLSAHHDRIDALRLAIFVLDGDLGLAVGTEPRKRAVFANLRKTKGQLVGEVHRQRHELLGLTDGIAEHDALVASALFLLIVNPLPHRHALTDIGRLAVESDHHSAGFVIKPLLRRVVADLPDRFASDMSVIHPSIRRNLAGNHNEAGGDHRFASNTGLGVLSEQRIEHRVGNLVRDLVWMTFGHRLRGKEIGVFHVFEPL